MGSLHSLPSTAMAPGCYGAPATTRLVLPPRFLVAPSNTHPSFPQPSRELVHTLRAAHQCPVHSLCTHPARPAFLSAAQDSIALWTTSGRWFKARTLNASSGVVTAAFVATGDRLVALLREGWIVAWDALTLTVQVRWSSSRGAGHIPDPMWGQTPSPAEVLGPILDRDLNPPINPPAP